MPNDVRVCGIVGDRVSALSVRDVRTAIVQARYLCVAGRPQAVLTLTLEVFVA
jgi:hypothetical protein